MRRGNDRGVVRRLAVATLFAVLAAACGDDGDDTAGDGDDDTVVESSTTTEADTSTTAPAETTTTAATTTTPTLTDSFRGVTADTIELGIAIADFDQLFEQNFVDFTHGDEEAIWAALIADVNDNGGVLGRELTATYETYLPIGPVEAEEKCLVFTEDQEVFAVLGLWVGDSVLCVTRDNDTIHVGHLVRQEWVDESSAVLATADVVEERQLAVLLDVLLETGRLDGRTVGVLTDVLAEGSVEEVVTPFLEANEITTGTVGVISDTTGDQPAVDTEVDLMIERWRSEGVDLVVVVGNNGVRSAARVREQLGLEVDVAVPASGVLRQASGSATDEQRPFYDGALSLAGLTADEAFAEEEMQRCISIVEAAVPDLTVVNPEELTEPEDWYAGIDDACTSLRLFVAAAEAAGPDLTNDSFRAGLESLGPIALPGKAHASTGPGKWDADDGFRLVVFRPDQGGDGGFEPVTDIVDTAAG